MDLGTQRVAKTLKDISKPFVKIPAIQIVGTNGKGSIASFIESGLKVAGVKVGVTTSPHLVSWCERIRINGHHISESDFTNSIKSLKPIYEKNNLTPFEIIIVTALDYFYSHKVDLIILEAGLGGRLDATTSYPLRPIIAIANINKDHCEYLGYSLDSIAKEKAAVITNNSSVISARQDLSVEKVLKETVKNKKARIKFVSSLAEDWDLGMNGDFQRSNAAVAKGVIDSLAEFGWEIDESLIREGFSIASWTGRLQKATWKKLNLIIDGAHNPSAMEMLSREREKWLNQENGINWLIGIQANKDGPQMIKNLIKKEDTMWILPIPNHDSWSHLELSKALPELSQQLHKSMQIEEVLEHILSQKNAFTKPTIITGSLYLIGDIIKKKLINLE